MLDLTLAPSSSDVCDVHTAFIIRAKKPIIFLLMGKRIRVLCVFT